LDKGNSESGLSLSVSHFTDLPRSGGFVKVLSFSLKAPFTTLCDYSLVPGVVVGISNHLLLLDTTGEPGGGGLELLDWHTGATGTALLPCFPDLVSEADRESH
jgi:hypothetical protein